MTKEEVRNLISEDIDNIMNIDLTGMSSEEVKKYWRKHLRHLDECKITQKEEASIRHEILIERNMVKEFDKKLSEVTMAILNV